LESYILSALILLILVEITALVNNIVVHRRNVEIYKYSEKGLIEQIDQLRESNKILYTDNKNLEHCLSKGLSDTAFVISNKGVQYLPEGWRDAVWKE
jgi:hypothetical protein